jgi:hypothetical protein
VKLWRSVEKEAGELSIVPFLPIAEQREFVLNLIEGLEELDAWLWQVEQMSGGIGDELQVE